MTRARPRSGPAGLCCYDVAATLGEAGRQRHTLGGSPAPQGFALGMAGLSPQAEPKGAGLEGGPCEWLGPAVAAKPNVAHHVQQQAATSM